MDPGDSGSHELLDLLRGKVDPGFELRRLIVPGGLEGACERLWQPGPAERGDPTDLREVRDGHHARHDRRLDAEAAAGVAEAEEVGVVVEELRDDDVAAAFHLALEILEVGLRGDGFLVGLGVAGHENPEARELGANQRHEFGGIREPAVDGLECRLTLGGIAAEGDDRRHAEGLGLAEVAAQFVDGAADAGEVAGDGDAVALPEAGEDLERLAAGRATGAVGAGDEGRLPGDEIVHRPPHRGFRLGRLRREEFEGEAEPAGGIALEDRHGG